MHIASRKIGNVTVIQFQGRLDAHQAPRITQHFQKVITPQSAQLVVNLEKVHFIDSIALAALAQGRMQCNHYNGDLRLCNLQQPVRIIFEVTKLYKVFSIYETETEAINTAWETTSATK